MRYPVIALIAAAVLSGCAVTPTSIVPYPTTTRAPMPEPVVATNGAIYQPSTYRPAFEDRRARHVGDTLIIAITERTNAVKAGASSGNKSNSASFGTPGLLQGRFGGSVAVEGKLSNSAGDNQSASNTFSGTIGVTVIEELPNGNLIVAGEKQIAMNKGTEFIRFSGMVNPDTIGIGNVVPSTQVADARVEYRTNSQIDRAEMASMASRFFLSLLQF